jgi:succinate dehydrogenase / fumarate reductase flavoprotein subunit
VRNESCGAHFREEYQTEDGEAVRNDEEYSYVSAWEFEEPVKWKLHKEHLEFETHTQQFDHVSKIVAQH